MLYEALHAIPFNTTVFFGGMIAAGIPGAVQVLSLWLSASMAQRPSESPESPSSEPSRT